MTSAPAPAPLPGSLHWGAQALWEQLSPLLPGIGVEVVAHIASTNSALLERARVASAERAGDERAQVRRSLESRAFGRRAADLQSCLLVAEHQTAGRGRQGRAWQATAGSSLTFSLSLPLNPPDWSGLSLAVGVALADALDPWDRLPSDRRPRVLIKWPNDLWLMDDAGEAPASIGRKLGGILIETVSSGAQRLAVIGIGLNVLPIALPAADTSTGFGCLHELDAGVSAPQALARVALPLVSALRQFEQAGFAAFADRFAARDLLFQRSISTTQADVPVGVAQGVSGSGALQVRSPAGVFEISSGEVSVRPAAGDPPASEAAPC
jgi:BirA family transcriptional regulator, biotin operon repressor / biotin---[acetyl-CoA-carboxylase] ligase